MNSQDWEPVIFNNTTKKHINTSNTKTSENSYEIDDNIEIVPKISLSNSLLIQKARISMKLSQTQVANKINIDVNIYKKYENGKTNPEYNILVKLEKLLHVKLNKKKKQ